MNTAYLPSKEDITNAFGLNALGFGARQTIGLLPAVEIFAAGLLVGAGLALLFAPKAGNELRHDIGERLGDVRGKVTDRVSSMAEKAESAVNRPA